MASTFKVPRLCTHASRCINLQNLPQSFFFRPPPSFFPLRQASKLSKGAPKNQEKPKKKRKARTTYIEHDISDAVQFSLVDAMRYIRAAEVGRDPTVVKYELAINLRSLKNGPSIRNRLKLPHPVKTAVRIAVLCPTPSPIAEQARAAGASIVGEDDLIASIKEGVINFDRLICHRDTNAKLNGARIARILGPKGLMPNTKHGTVVSDIGKAVRGLVGGAEYRERVGVIRLAIGNLSLSPEELARNIKVLIESIKKDSAQMSDKIAKEIHEVVLSSTNSPGFTLNGEFKSASSPPTSDLTLATF